MPLKIPMPQEFYCQLGSIACVGFIGYGVLLPLRGPLHLGVSLPGGFQCKWGSTACEVPLAWGSVACRGLQWLRCLIRYLDGCVVLYT